MIGPLEIVIIIAILLVIFGAKFLPALGRNAGKGVRIGREKGSEIATKVTDKAEGYDPKQIARTAGEHVRDARDLRDEFRGEGSTASKPAEDRAAADEPTEEKPAEPNTADQPNDKETT
jgi:sec-independent protein translocase protein TatA